MENTTLSQSELEEICRENCPWCLNISSFLDTKEGLIELIGEMNRQIKQSQLNFDWLLEKMESAHDNLCEQNVYGTWQMRAEQLSQSDLKDQVKELKNQIKVMEKDMEILEERSDRLEESFV